MISDLLHALNDPHARHAMAVHLPVVLAPIGFVLVAGYAARRLRDRRLGAAAVALYVLTAVGAGIAAGAGEDALDEVRSKSTPPLTAGEKMALERHADLGDGGWVWPLIPAGFLALTFVPRRRVRGAAGGASVLAAAGVVVWIVLTADAGGRLVYTHGLGVPARGQADPQIKGGPPVTPP